MAPPPVPATDPKAFDRIERLAYWMDERFVVPGTNWRIGLDGLLGLLPVFGDTASMLVSLYIVFEARRLGAPASLITRMLFNVGVDELVGSIPVLGDWFDFGFKANRKNLRLLQRHLAKARNG